MVNYRSASGTDDLPAIKLIELLQSISFLQAVPHAALAALAAVARVQEVRANERVFWEGETSAGLYVIEDGCIKVCRHSAEGREHILHLLYRGDTFNDVATLDGGENPASAIAHTAARIWRIERESLMHVAQMHPALAWALLESLAQRVRYLVGVVEGLTMRSVRGRLAQLLLEQSDQAGTLSMPRTLTQEEMANRLGTVREMVGRGLRALADEGVIEFDRQTIRILDRDKLAASAEA